VELLELLWTSVVIGGASMDLLLDLCVGASVDLMSGASMDLMSGASMAGYFEGWSFPS